MTNETFERGNKILYMIHIYICIRINNLLSLS